MSDYSFLFLEIIALATNAANNQDYESAKRYLEQATFLLDQATEKKVDQNEIKL